MDTGTLVYIIAVPIVELLLLFCGAFFAATETGYTSLSRITVRQMLKGKEKHASLVARLRSRLDSLISTALVGTNLVTTLISSLATAYVIELFGDGYVSAATAVVSILVIIFSEIIPKTYAAIRPKEIAVMSAMPIVLIQKCLFPVVWLFDCLSRLIHLIESRLIPYKRPLVTEDELRTLLDVGKDEGTLEAIETQMLVRLFDFSDKDCLRSYTFLPSFLGTNRHRRTPKELHLLHQYGTRTDWYRHRLENRTHRTREGNPVPCTAPLPSRFLPRRPQGRP